jgi:hypothetical protein
MKGRSIVCVGLAGLIHVLAASSPAATLLNYQGRLLDTNGAPVNAVVNIAVGIYTSLSASVASCVEDVGNVTVQNGLYAFTYGTNESAVLEALSHPEAWLELRIDGTPLLPRQRLNSSPYALNVDERGLVQSTQFLLDMVARHEMEIEAMRGKLGLGLMPGGGDYFLESFPDANGQHDAVNVSLTDAFYNPSAAFYSPFAAISVAAEANTSASYLLRDVSNINARVQYVEDDLRFWDTNSPNYGFNYLFYYADGAYVSNVVSRPLAGTNWVTFRMDNPYPEKIVTRYRLHCPYDGVYVRNTVMFTDRPATSRVTVAVNLPAISNRMTHVALYGTLVNRVPQDGMDFAITDGTTTFTNLPANTKTPLAGMSNNPNRVFIHLYPGTTNSIANTGLESMMLKWWAQ